MVFISFNLHKGGGSDRGLSEMSCTLVSTFVLCYLAVCSRNWGGFNLFDHAHCWLGCKEADGIFSCVKARVLK